MTHLSPSTQPTASFSRVNRDGIGIWALVSTWVATTVLGMAYLAMYEHQPGQSHQAPATWPQESEIIQSPARPTLLMFAHPRCACTRASLDELARLVAHCHDQVDIHVLFVKPDGAEHFTSWESTNLWHIAQQIPGVELKVDDLGREAQRFAALTSGQALLYGVEGNLLFQGGITSSRGHSGDNTGRSSITALIHGESPESVQTEVFGCELGTKQGLAACCQQ